MIGFDRPSVSPALETYRGIVQPWECDRNNHWNTRFYISAFQMASEALAITRTGTNPGAATACMRHLRFHRELLAGAAVTVQSAGVETGPYTGRVAHLLRANGHICATAMDLPETSFPSDMSPWSQYEIELAQPRSLDPEKHDPLPERSTAEQIAPVGIVRPSHLDHTGALMMNEAFASCSSSSYSLMDRIGFSHEYVKQSGRSRMVVEMKVTRHESPAAGEAMQARSKIQDVKEKTFSIRHQVETAGGWPLFTIEQLMITTDVTTRRAVAIPEGIREALLGARGDS